MDMSRLSFRPRPLDIHKKLPIFRSIKDFEDDETTTSTRNSQIQRIAAETDIEVPHNNSKKNSAEIPIPQFVVVDTYERDYACTFTQPSTYVRARGARSELGEYVEYDLDNEDIDWLEEFNLERKIITPEKLESILFKFEVLDHKARERAGVIMPTLGPSVPVHLTLEVAAESLQSSSVRFSALQPIYSYWKQKRERWQKPILRKLQPPPPINDTNPYNVFRPREKIHRLHTRRMQRRENNIQSFEKLRLVRRNLQQAKTMLEALIKREEKKREAMDCEVNLQRLQMKYKNDTRLIDDGVALPTFSSFKAKHALTEEDLINSNEMENGYSRFRQPMKRKIFNVDSKWMMAPVGHMKYKSKRGSLKDRWLHEREPHEPIMLFTGSLDPEKLAAAGITEPPNPQIENDSSTPLYHFRGRIGRGEGSSLIVGIHFDSLQ